MQDFSQQTFLLRAGEATSKGDENRARQQLVFCELSAIVLASIPNEWTKAPKRSWKPEGHVWLVEEGSRKYSKTANGVALARVSHGLAAWAADRGINAVMRMNAIVRNKFRDDSAALSAWESANHIERRANGLGQFEVGASKAIHASAVVDADCS